MSRKLRKRNTSKLQEIKTFDKYSIKKITGCDEKMCIT